jgi:hypothetical protein
MKYIRKNIYAHKMMNRAGEPNIGCRHAQDLRAVLRVKL